MAIILEITQVLLKSYGKPFLLVQMSGGIIGKTRYSFCLLQEFDMFVYFLFSIVVWLMLFKFS